MHGGFDFDSQSNGLSGKRKISTVRRPDSDVVLNALVIEDNPQDTAYIRGIAEEALHVQLSTSSSVPGDRGDLDESLYDLVLLDASASNHQGILTAKKVAGRFPDIPVIVMTGHENDKEDFLAAGAEVGDFLSKDGLTPEAFRQTVLSALERHRAKRDFWSERINFMTVVEHQPDANILVDGGVICYANPAAAALFGRSVEDLIGSPFGLPTGSDTADEVDILKPDGSLSVAELRAKELSADHRSAHLVVLRDVSRERRARLAVRQLERSYSLYQSVEYLLHEMNNPIAALLSHLKTSVHKFDRVIETIARQEETLSDGADEEGELLRFAREVKKSLSHAHESCLRLASSVSTLGKARPSSQKEAPASTPLLSELNLAVDIVERSYSGKTKIKREYGALPRVSAHPLRLAEVFCAVVRNAVESVADKEGGEVVIYTAMLNNRVLVKIEDNGPGVPGHLKEKIFMPFFSTRKRSSAVGLGLTLAQDIIKGLGGDIFVDRSSAGGARFTVCLPIDESRHPPSTLQLLF